MIADIKKRDSQTVNVFWWKKKITICDFLPKNKINNLVKPPSHLPMSRKPEEEEDVKWHHSVTISKILTVKSSTEQVTKFILQTICKGGRKRTYKLKGSSRDITIKNNAWTLKKWKWKLLSYVGLFESPWTVHRILQARILEWVAIPFFRGSSWPRNWTEVSCIAGRFLTSWAIREAQ